MFLNKFQSKNILVLSLLLLIALTTVACGGKASTEPITEINWQWVSLSETEPASLSITPDPENYTLTLLPDDTLSIKADCNMVKESYELVDSLISIELGPSTRAFCGEQSLDVQYLQLLSEVENYTTEDGQLVLELIEDAGEMIFKSE
jgi:heat shock protein HslJ